LLKLQKYSWLPIFALVLGLDKFTKFVASSHLAYGQPVNFMPGFNLRLAHNTGAAFSFLAASKDSWERWFLTIFTTAIVLFLLKLIKNSNNLKREIVPLALIIGGACGNLLDRLQYGYVVDWIDIYFLNYHWPTFNIADTAICVGAVIYALFAQETTASSRQQL